MYLEDRPITGIVGDGGVSEVIVENSGERLEYYIKKKKKSGKRFSGQEMKLTRAGGSENLTIEGHTRRV